MERTKSEVAKAPEFHSEVAEANVLELSELQLTFVGGGIVDGVPH
jgi:hypothetical protein